MFTYFQCPKDNSNAQVNMLLVCFQVNPKQSERNYYQGDVKMKKRFIKGMTNGGRRMQSKQKEADAGLLIRQFQARGQFAGSSTLTIRPLVMN